MKREAKLQTLWSKIMSELPDKIYCNYELKQTQTGYLSFKSFEPQQLESLHAMKYKGLHVKHSDADPRLKPCDGHFIPPQPTFIVVRYYDSFIMIDIDDFINESNGAKTSLSHERARELAYKIFYI